ncbi:alpha/beta hydrolase [Legionella bononiensis]|uniref:Alpha/beta hydrolase n=1 Tax=Legionella bononiensis TaxID=2793102 RepID=A0ABS1WGA7_9GAMM|nr:alpha/beta hydrolase [Legionella bononiensis]MBL7481838.1 alpha/beta hydrolase [Legionella bononiensis]MBL7528387.1 alpha/beta hydrolase [Legionella bononiensis]MBL7564350.1 alpha/beta hydrolase [Legionella bononiensis]
MVKQILLIACVIFGCVLLLMYVFQRNLIYFPDRHIPNLKKFHAQDMVLVTIHTADNLKLKSWYKPADKNQPTILYLHGNAGHIGYRMPLARQFLDSGIGLLLLEYRGYGGNIGSPTEQGFYKDGEAAVHYLLKQGIAPQKIVLFGESLGTGVATKIANQHQFCAIILQSPFTSLVNLSRYHYPWLFISPWDKYNSLKRITKINAPLLVLHGTRDQIVPYSEGLKLFNEALEPKKMHTLQGYDHNNLWSSPGFSQEIIHFIYEYCH